jgi:hypothetical protein
MVKTRQRMLDDGRSACFGNRSSRAQTAIALAIAKGPIAGSDLPDGHKLRRRSVRPTYPSRDAFWVGFTMARTSAAKALSGGATKILSFGSPLPSPLERWFPNASIFVAIAVARGSLATLILRRSRSAWGQIPTREPARTRRGFAMAEDES